MGCSNSTAVPADAPTPIAAAPAPAPAEESKYLAETKSALDFKKVMGDGDGVGADAMLKFATSMLSEENTSFWMLATVWRKELASSGEGDETLKIEDADACERAKAIIAKHLKGPSAELPVNLPARVVTPFAKEPDAFTLGMFDEALKEATIAIKTDTFEIFSRHASGFALAKEHPELCQDGS